MAMRKKVQRSNKLFYDACLMLDASNSAVKKETQKNVGLLQSLREKIKQFRKYPAGKKLYIVVSSLIKVVAGAAVTTTAALKAIQMIKKSEITFEEFMNQKNEFDKPIFPAPIRLAVQATLTSLRVFAKLMGFNIKSNKSVSRSISNNGLAGKQQIDPMKFKPTNRNDPKYWEQYMNWRTRFGKELERVREIEQQDKPVNLSYSNEQGGILDTVFKNNTKGIMAYLSGLHNLKEVQNSGANISGAIDDVKDVLAEAQDKLSDRAHRLASQSITGGNIQKDLDEAHMRIAKINFLLRQKGALSGAASAIIQSAQDMVTKMAVAAKRMRATDSLFGIRYLRRNKRNRLVTHDSMPWSRRRYKDGIISNLVDKLKQRIMTIIAICKHSKNKLYNKIFLVATEILGALGGLTAIYFTGKATKQAAEYLSILHRGRKQMDDFNKAISQTTTFNGLQVNRNAFDPLAKPKLVQVEISAVIAGLGAFIAVVTRMANKWQFKYSKKDPNYLPE